MDQELEKLIDRYLDEGLSLAETEELNDLLLSSKDFRILFKKKVQLHASLNSHYDAVDFETLYGERLSKKNNILKFQPWTFVAKVAMILLACLFVYENFNKGSGHTLARVSYSLQAEWMEGFVPGERMGKGSYKLNDGMVELEMPNDVTIALEGPVSFSLVDEKTVRLHKGKLSADVGEKGRGFVVITPDGKVVDLGTRFGVLVPESGKTEAHVFKGEINVVIDEKTTNLKENEAVKVLSNGHVSETDVDNTNFPMPGYHLDLKLKDSDFEEGVELKSHWPVGEGYWGGDHCEVINSFDDVYPAKGSRMLHFVKPHLKGATNVDHNNSELWQMIDLRNFDSQISLGGMTARLSAKFNQVSEGRGDVKFNVSLIAFNGNMKDAKNYWDAKNHPLSELISESNSQFYPDLNPETWQTIGCKLDIPGGTDFVLIQLSAQLTSGEGQFVGHFVDDVSLSFDSEPRKSFSTVKWIGQGNFSADTNWELNRVPDFSRQRLVLEGEEAKITSEINVKQEMIIALSNESKGSLEIAESGVLNISRNGSLLVGYNKLSVAELKVKGTLKTLCKSHIGRNNFKSDVIVDGGLWDASNSSIRMSQYSREGYDTESNLKIMNGGKVFADRIEMIHDRSKIKMVSGKLVVKALTVGGDDGEAIFEHHQGEVRVDRIVFGLKSKYEFIGEGGGFYLKGRYDLEELRKIPQAKWFVDGQPLGEGDLDFSFKEIEGELYTSLRRI